MTTTNILSIGLDVHKQSIEIADDTSQEAREIRYAKPFIN